MATPTMITITGNVQTPPGTPDATFMVILEQEVWLVHADGTLIEPTIYRGVVNASGQLFAADGVSPFRAPSTTDPAWTPVGWTYRVTFDPEDNLPQRAPFRAGLSHLAPGGTVTLGSLLPVPASGGSLYSPLNHTHDISASAITAIESRDRLVIGGELVLPREQGGDSFQMVSGRMYATHFTALTTETILTVRTTCTQAAVGAQHAWIGFMKWTGTNYTLDSISVDDPTRWISLTNYPTQVFQTDDAHFGAADLTRPGFNKVAGQKYIQITQWVGTVSGPKLMGQLVNASDAFVEPRQNGYMDLVAPPSSALMAGWLVGSPFKFQGLLQS